MNSVHWPHQINTSPCKTDSKSEISIPKIKKRITKQDTPIRSIKELYKQHNWLDLIEQANNQDFPQETYDQIKIQGNIINKNDVVMIKSKSKNMPHFIGIIREILSIQEPVNKKLICLCKMQWYLQKDEILIHKPRCKKWISDQEIFQTEVQEYVLAQTIMTKCQVLKCDEYMKLEEIEDNMYFSRLQWDGEQKMFTNIKDVDRYCLCDQPLNPDLFYIQCDKCEKWFHFDCVGVKSGQYENKEYYCMSCKRSI